jgi:hypothetical protein
MLTNKTLTIMKYILFSGLCVFIVFQSFIAKQNNQSFNSDDVSIALVDGQTIDVDPFTSIKTSGNVTVELIKGTAPKAEFTIIKGREEDLIIKVEGDVLTVKIKSQDSWYNTSNTKALVKVYYQNLNDITSAAGSSVQAKTPIKSENLKVDGSSGASISLIVDTEKIKIEASSGCSISINGKSDTASYDASSGSSISCRSLIANNVDVSASSGASASVFANEKIKADASSGASINYGGSPKEKNIDSGKYSGGSVSGN